MNKRSFMDIKIHRILGTFFFTFISFALLFGLFNPVKAFIDDGSIDPNFESSSLVDGPIYSILNQPDGKVLGRRVFS